MTSTDLARLAARAETIHERLRRSAGRVGLAGISPDPASPLLRRWRQAYASGDAEALRRRLAWEGLDEAAIALAADGIEPPDPPLPWTDWIAPIAAAARSLAADVASGRFAGDDGLRVPFEEVWTAFRHAARSALASSGGGAIAVGGAALIALERQLCAELSRQGEMALLESLRATVPFPAAGADAGPDGQYRACVSGWLTAGLVPVFEAYPALARALVSLCVDWVDATRELLSRIADDRPAIAERFGIEPGPVTAIVTGLSDPHRGRRRVAIVTFASGLRLVYKPRTIGMDVCVAGLLQRLSRGLRHPLPTLRALDRGPYGWIEFAVHAEASTRADAARCFYQFGALLGAAYVLGATDLHLENVIVTAAGPVVVDAEMFCQPVAASPVADAEEDDQPARSPERAGIGDRSVLDSGLLSLITVTPTGAVYDSGGMRGQTTGASPFPQRVWQSLRSDALRWEESPTFRAAGTHRVLIAGSVQDPGDFTAEVLLGFDDVYRAFVADREALLAADGPLAAFARVPVRITLRPTDQYARLSAVLANPAFQRDGLERSVATEVLYRAWARATARPALWPAAVEERRALERLDVPYFTARAESRDLEGSDDNIIVANHFARSGLDAVRARVRRLSDTDLAIQRRSLEQALLESPASRLGGEPSARTAERPDEIAIARWIGEALRARQHGTGRGPTWRDVDGRRGVDRHAVYSGTMGPALFFAAMAATSGEEAWHEHAGHALKPIEQAIESGELAGDARESIGGLSGAGSIVYGLTVTAALLDRPDLLEMAIQVAVALEPGIAPDRRLDVLDGAAGAALALLALSDAAPQTAALRWATACGHRLVETAVDDGDGRCWATSGGRHLLGFAHGAAGIVHALARLHAATGEPRFRDAAAGGCRFIARQYRESSANYPIAAARGGEPGGAMLAWCHGAPGIVLGLGRQLDICPETAILSQFDAAFRTVARDEPAQVDHLCCGASGRIETLLVMGRARGREDLVDDARRLSEAMTTRALARGHFRLSGSGVAYRVFDPGFFQGLSGIGYEYLRLASAALPSIAGLESPAGRVRQAIDPAPSPTGTGGHRKSI